MNQALRNFFCNIRTTNEGIVTLPNEVNIINLENIFSDQSERNLSNCQRSFVNSNMC